MCTFNYSVYANYLDIEFFAVKYVEATGWTLRIIIQVLNFTLFACRFQKLEHCCRAVLRANSLATALIGQPYVVEALQQAVFPQAR
eukprot:scaffold196642_cov37-Prasinocladus_malaysianus.AAC.1